MTDREALDMIHAVMSFPFEWDSGTIEVVADVMTSRGYTFPTEEAVDALYEKYGDGLSASDAMTARFIFGKYHPKDA
jgi:hypothetical protein